MPNIYERVLITGGGGMLAHALVQLLQQRSVQPLVLSRDELDITSPQLASVLERITPTIVLNCAAYTKVDLCEQSDQASAVNANGALNLAFRSEKVGAKLIHFSTDFVFDGRNTKPYRPDDRTNPLSAYGASKRGGEIALQSRKGLNYLIIRTSWLYGLHGPNFVQTMLNVARAGKPLTVVDDQIGSPTFTHDLADVTLDLIDRGATGIFHATNSGQTSWFEFAKAIFEEFDVPDVDLKSISSAKWKESRPSSAVRPAYSVLDCSATEQLIGRQIPHWRDALHRYRLETEAESLR